jgi:hypothetical protein
MAVFICSNASRSTGPPCGRKIPKKPLIVEIYGSNYAIPIKNKNGFLGDR